MDIHRDFSFSAFSQNFFTLLKGESGVFSETEWTLFLEKYFPEDTDSFQKEMLEDLDFFRSHDPASSHYS